LEVNSKVQDSRNAAWGPQSSTRYKRNLTGEGKKAYGHIGRAVSGKKAESQRPSPEALNEGIVSRRGALQSLN